MSARVEARRGDLTAVRDGEGAQARIQLERQPAGSFPAEHPVRTESLRMQPDEAHWLMHTALPSLLSPVPKGGWGGG